MADVKLTSAQVKCAKCVDCMNNRLRLEMDKPGQYGCSYPCVVCYTDRLRAQCDLDLAKMSAMQDVSWLYKDKFDRTYLDNEGDAAGNFVRGYLLRLSIVKEWRQKLKEIDAMTDAKAVEAVGKAARDEYFGRKDGKGAANGR